MSEEVKKEQSNNQNDNVVVNKSVKSSPSKNNVRVSDSRNRNSADRSRRQRRSREKRKDKNDDPFDSKIINIRRVTRMFKGGRRMRLSVFVAVGDRRGNVGVGIGKGMDVRSAQEKAVTNAKKNLVKVNLKGNTIPHNVDYKFRAAKIFMKPASPGTGIVAGSSMRAIAELAGISDILGKIQGTTNPITNAYATVYALESLKSRVK